MALAVETTSFGSVSNSGSLTVTAPTGIQENDLLVFVVHSYVGTDIISATGFTKSFVDLLDLTGTSDDANISVFWKLATVADESEANYSATSTITTRGMAGVLLRVSGWGADLEPVFASGDSGSVSILTSGGPFTGTMSSSFSRLGQNLSIIAASAFDSEPFNGEITVGNYQLNSSDSNPTWTEVCDVPDTYYDAGADHAALALAYATATDTSDVTGYSVDYTEVGLGDISLGFAVGFTINEPMDATGTAALVTANTETFGITGTCDGIAQNVLAEATAESFTQTGRGEAPTQWAEPTKVVTDWTNKEI